ncbi:MAG: putative glycoside hydrolase [Pygmaiobacter sp.]
MGKNKPVKVKRYKRSFSGSGEHILLARKIVFWAVLLAVLFGIGWLIAKPGLDLATGLWYKHKNGDTTLSSSVSSEVASVQTGSSAPETPPAPPLALDSSAWVQVSLSAVASPEQAAALAAELAGRGVTDALITLKDETGSLYYKSSLALAQGAISPSAIDAAAIATAFSDAGVTPIAGIAAFSDASAPYADRTLAVKYQNTDYNWLDNSKELGGKPWLNPNSPAAQSYIGDVLREVKELGYAKILVTGLQFPSGYSLDACGYGTMTKTKQQLLTEIGKQYEAIEGTEVWFEFPAPAISAADVRCYGASPATFGFKRVVVRDQSTASTAADGTSVLTPPATDVASLSALYSALTNSGTEQAAYYLAGFSGDELAAVNDIARQAGFTITLTQ